MESFNEEETVQELESFLELSMLQIEETIFGEKASVSKKKMMAWSFPIVFISLILESAIHECGHALWVIIFGGRVYEIAIFPLTLFLHNSISSGGYIFYGGSFSQYEDTVINIAGTMTVFLVSCFILLIVFHKKRNFYVELFAYWFILIISVELFIYPLFDLFSYEEVFTWITDVSGDWQKVYEVYPYTRYLMVAFGCIWLVFVIYLTQSKKREHVFEV